MTSTYDSGHEPPILLRHRLRIAREYAGLERQELADLIGISPNTVSNAENGHGKQRKITINAWSMACGVPVSWILGNDEALAPAHPLVPTGGQADETAGGTPKPDTPATRWLAA